MNHLMTRLADEITKDLSEQSLLFRLITTPLARLYDLVTAGRNFRFDRSLAKSYALPGCVVSIGNIVAGGTGKSPIVMRFAERLIAQGKQPAILTRGYGSGLAKGDSMVLLGGELLLPPQGIAAIPDEARMQSAMVPTCPVVIGSDRYSAAQRWLASGRGPAPSHWLLDDGFQHRRLRRHFDIVLLDARMPFGNGLILPQGTLRESLSGLKRASAILFTRAEDGSLTSETLAYTKQLGIPTYRVKFALGAAKTVLEPHRDFCKRSDNPVLLVTAIAQPQRFRKQLELAGFEIAGEYIGADHAPFNLDILRKHLPGASAIVTTAKDYWRDPTIFMSLPIPVFIQSLQVDLSDDLIDKLLMQAGN